MPTYEYECENCKHTFDYMQSMNDDKLIKCPECKKDTLIRLISGGGAVIFKGEGFHCNDYASPTKDVRHPSVGQDERIVRRKKAMKTIRDNDTKKKKRHF